MAVLLLVTSGVIPIKMCSNQSVTGVSTLALYFVQVSGSNEWTRRVCLPISCAACSARSFGCERALVWDVISVAGVIRSLFVLHIDGQRID